MKKTEKIKSKYIYEDSTGRSFIKDTYIPVEIIKEYIDKGYSKRDILERLPTLKKDELNFIIKCS